MKLTRATIPQNILFFFSALIATFLLISLLNTHKVSAAYDGGRIIDNSVFLDANSMSMQEIQNFLVARGSGIANRSFVLNCYGPTSQERQWYTAVGAPCDQTVPASNIIYYASQIYGVSPKAVLATLQKEQSLITSPNPTDWQIEHAMGYGCPTTGTCSSSNFFGQIDSGVWVLRYHYERANGNMTWWSTSTTWTCGTQKNFYSPNLYPNQNVNFSDEDGVMYRTHFLANAATSSFYCYTPHAYNNPQGLYGRAPYGTVGRYYSGSYNFVYFFELWFGSTIGPDYSWSIESYTYSGGDNLITAGQTETITLRAKNTGRVPWYNHGSCPVRLGTWEPAGRTSSLAHSSWLSASKITNQQESVVQPNEVGTFSFQIAPGTAGTYAEGLNLVVENCQWMQWPGLRPTITVTGQYSWQIEEVIYGNGTGVMEPGSQQLITVKARNTGGATWDKFGGSPVRLGTWPPNRQSPVSTGWSSSTRIEMNGRIPGNESTVPPGSVAGFQFYVRIPSGGNFYERFNLVSEGVAWFNDPGLTLYLQGKSYAWQPVWHSVSTSNVNIPRNQDFVITIRVRNTGEMAWKKTDPFKIRLATVEPQNRGSALYHSSWIDGIRPATLVDDTVLPGQEGTITFNARTPSTPGVRNERFSLVAEGIQWFNDPGFNIYINVL